MLSKVLLALTFVSVVSTHDATAGFTILGSASNPANGHSYYLLAAGGWHEAEATAVELGGHLATINNTAENQWVASTFSSLGGEPRSLWIGLNDALIEGVFIWASGETVSYTNWGMAEPSNSAGIEDYAYIYAPDDIGEQSPRWNDFAAAGPAYGLVEVSSVPLPPTIAVFVAMLLFLAKGRNIVLNSIPPFGG